MESPPKVYVIIEDEAIPFRQKGGLGVEVKILPDGLGQISFSLDSTDTNRERALGWIKRGPQFVRVETEKGPEFSLRRRIHVTADTSFSGPSWNLNADGVVECGWFEITFLGECLWTQ